jgi:hypothetical protein
MALTAKGHDLYACASQQQPTGKQASVSTWQQVRYPTVLPSNSDLYSRNLFKAAVLFLLYANS